MEHKGTKCLETPRLILRRFTVEDAPAMYQNWASDPEVTKFLTWPTHPDASVSENILRDWVSHYDEPTYYQWAIVFKPFSARQPIGSIAVVHSDDSLEMVHLGYCIGRVWWHHGVVSEALRRVMEYLFTEVGANRIEARHDPRNTHSGEVMKKCGMLYEGTRRQADRNNQGLCDAACYAMLASDWPGAL